MRIILLIAFSLFITSSYAQDKPIKIKKNKEYTSKTGLKYTVYEINKKALKCDSGDNISVHYVGKLADGTIFDDSYSRSQPISFNLGEGRVIKGWDEGLQYLHLGDSALFVIPADIAYGARAVGKIPANSTLYFTVKVVALKKGLKPWDVSKVKKVELDSAFSYQIVQKGSGDPIEVGDMAYVQYSGYFTNGKLFDSSHLNGGVAFSFILGRHRVIDGWEKGVVGMRTGEKRRISIPYKLAYGENGRMPIPPKTDLIFDVELEKIEKIEYPKFDTEGKDTVTLRSGLKYMVIKKTEGEIVKPEKTVVIQYVGRFTDGRVFDSTYDRGDSLTFIAAKGSVIKGLDEGMTYMRKGEKYRFIIPYSLAYGEEGRLPLIPRKADLIFDVYLQNIK